MIVDLADDRGQAGGIEVLPFGVLIFVAGALLAANAWGVIDAKLAVTAAAREAARSFVEADDGRSGLTAATEAARGVMRGHGRDPDRLRLRPTGRPFSRCARIGFEASYRVPAIALPWIGGYGHGFTVRATHTEIVDPFRAGLAGKADCD